MYGMAVESEDIITSKNCWFYFFCDFRFTIVFIVVFEFNN